MSLTLGLEFSSQEPGPLQILPLGKVVLQIADILGIIESCQDLVEYLQPDD